MDGNQTLLTFTVLRYIRHKTIFYNLIIRSLCKFYNLIYTFTYTSIYQVTYHFVD